MLDRELAAAHRAGLTAVERLPRAPLAPFDTGPCLRFPSQGQFHPLKYLAGLARAIERDGGRIFTGTHAASIEGGTPARVKSAAGPTVTADAVVVATNTPINDRVAIHTKQAPYLTYAIGARVPRGSVAGGSTGTRSTPTTTSASRPSPPREGLMSRRGPRATTS